MALIDPLISLALALHGTRGAHAVLLGSGVSRAAQIPTGWEVVLDLIARLAAAHGEQPLPTPEAWYAAKFGTAPNYVDILKAVAKTAPDRQRLLRAYFEPTPDEAARGVKTPTAAHRAIASLVRDGYVRVIVTTNFDRLMERALDEMGVTPTVIQSADGFRGAHPFQHNVCTLLKVHGDYLDTRIRNTEDEVGKYPREQKRALDRVFEEHGLIICGWSGDYDVALKETLERCAGRRYGAYWVTRGAIGATGAALTNAIRADIVATSGADEFFVALGEKVASLERLAQPHPLSPALAAETTKRYLVDAGARIRLSDLVRDETSRSKVAALDAATKSLALPFDGPSLTKTLEAYEAAVATLAAILATGAFWSDDEREETRRVWSVPIARVGAIAGPLNGNSDYCGLARYPATLLAYCVGVGACARDHYLLLKEMLLETRVAVGFEPELVASALHLTAGPNLDHVKRALGAREWMPLHQRLCGQVRRVFSSLIPEDRDFERALYRFEYLWALSVATRPALHPHLPAGWGPPGFFWVSGGMLGRPPVMNEVQVELDRWGHQWPPLRQGLIAGTTESLPAVQAAYDAIATHWRLSQG